MRYDSVKLTPTGPMADARNQSGRTVFSNEGEPDQVSTLTRSTPPLPFTISISQHNSAASSPQYTLTLMIPPSEFSLSSSNVGDSQFTRLGPLPTLWGNTQPIIALQGSSAAFITEVEGLSSSMVKATTGVSRTDSIGYNNFMGLVAMFKANGYKHLKDDEDVFPGRKFPGQTTRVIHVLDCVKISYDGTTYFGHFTDLSFNDDAQSPFHFKYSLSFTVTGIKGDFVGGHIGDGYNQNSGILIGDSSSEINRNMNISKEALQIDKLDEKIANEAHYNSGTSAGGAASPSESNVVKTVSGLSGNSIAMIRYEKFNPKRKEKFDTFLQGILFRGYSYVINSSSRSVAEQSAIYNDDNPPESKHFYDAAIDIQITEAPGSSNYLPNAFERASGTILTAQQRSDIIAAWVKTGIPDWARQCGLKWGGNFSAGHGAGDCVHFELKDDIDTLRSQKLPLSTNKKGGE